MLGFPDETNTGVTPGTVLTVHNGELVINTDGAVIENLDIRGNVVINADNVTIRNCLVTTGDFWGISMEGGGRSSGGTNATVENCTIVGLGNNTNGALVGGGTWLRNDISGFENGMVVDGSDVLIQDNYIHDLQGDGHKDGIAIHGSVSDVVIRHNTVFAPSTATAAVFITNDFGPVTNVVVDNNLLSGGQFTVYSDEKSQNPGQINGVQYINNVIDRGNFGWVTVSNNTIVWSGNTDLDTGRTINQNNTLGTVPDGQVVITAFSTDSGVVGDGITNDDTVTLTGTAAANSTVEVFDGATLLGEVMASGSGAWSFTTAALADGIHSFTADAGGTPSAALSVTVDTVAPSAPTIDSFASDTGTVGDGITTDNTLTLTGTGTGSVKVFDGSTLLGTVTGNGTWNFSTGTLPNGAHNFTATAADAAGNTSGDSSALAVTVEAAPPPPPPPTVINGTNGNNTLNGTAGPDVIRGLGGSDTLRGNAGDDRLIGGTSNDQLYGGAGADAFAYENISESLPGFGKRDLIWDFEQGIDKIDLSVIDAKQGVSGNQAFTFMGEGVLGSSQSGVVKFHYDAASNRTLVEGTVNTSGGIDFQVSLVGQHALTANDFVL